MATGTVLWGVAEQMVGTVRCPNYKLNVKNKCGSLTYKNIHTLTCVAPTEAPNEMMVFPCLLETQRSSCVRLMVDRSCHAVHISLWPAGGEE